MNSVKPGFLASYYLPGLPHILLAKDDSPACLKLHNAFKKVKDEIDQLNPDLLVIYSTYWPSVLGHQIQARPEPEWTHVDDQFHSLGEINYKFKMDSVFAEGLKNKCIENGLRARTIDYHGFPIDTGSVVNLKLLNPNNKIPAVILSSNVYSDRAETLIFGKSVKQSIEAAEKKAVLICVSSLSNRLLEHTQENSEKIYSLKDEEWNQKVLEFFKQGRIEDLSQLSRQFHREARVQKVNNYKPMWFMSACLGETNDFKGSLYEYQTLYGTGNAVIGLTPSLEKANQLEFDESSPHIYEGEKDVLGDLDFPERVSLGKSKAADVKSVSKT